MIDGIVAIDLGFVNAYLLRAGEGYVLVDTGIASQRAKLERALAAAGCEPGKLSLVVITHADMDHAGNAKVFQAEWRVPVAAHAADAAFLAAGSSPKRRGRGPLSSALMGLSGLARLAGGGAMKAQALVPDFLLADGQGLEAWGLAARVLHLPGHTPGSIALLTAEGSLVAGDVFANRGRPDVSPFVESLEDYRASLGRAKALIPSIATVYPGHGRSFPGSAIAAIEL